MSSHDVSIRRRPAGLLAAAVALFCALAGGVAARATLPEWLQHAVASSPIEAALFRGMALPSVQALYPRPPKEAQGELAHLISARPEDAELYVARGRADEAALDFRAAEADWKLAVAHAGDPVAAKMELANYFHRRAQYAQEIETLLQVGAAPAIAPERFLAAGQQRSWRAFDRALGLIGDQGLPAAQTTAAYGAFLARYPGEPAVYVRLLNWQMQSEDWAAAETSVARYRKAFPQDEVFPVRAEALLDFRRGEADKSLALYDRSFQPLWPAELVQSWFALLAETHRERAVVAEARTRLAQHPDGPEALNAVARIFYHDQQAGRLDKAQATLDAFRAAREARNGTWTPAELLTLAALTEGTHRYAEAARYDFALASLPGAAPNGEPAAQLGLSNLTRLLLSAPDQPIALGAGNLTLLRDIATVDQGPGYWNGILSLWLNGTSPAREYETETGKAQAYFHRSKAADLLSVLDAKYPTAPERAGLHAEMIRAYAQYGEPRAVVTAGKEFLAGFRDSEERVAIANLMADAYSRERDTADEFALYDASLAELAAKTERMPLTAGAAPGKDAVAEAERGNGATQAVSASAVALIVPATQRPAIPAAAAYAQVLDRYLGRLVAEGRLPQALAVWRRQLDLYPDDPLLYERLATFLQQNNLSGQQEETYRLAIARFRDAGWYDKLARLYLRERNRAAYTALTRQVTDIFAGTEVDAWFARAGTLGGFNQPNQPALGPELALQLNLYAARRFPHDLVFIRNLLDAYTARPTANRAAYDALLRRHWWEDDSLRDQFFADLARTGKLEAELNALRALTPAGAAANPAATRELAEAEAWSSHFEAAAPLMGALTELYPADTAVGNSGVSLYRSLAYLDPTPQSRARAIAVETRLLEADPSNAERLATLGDLYAEATSTGGEDLGAAAPYWNRLPALHPGTPEGYLTAATVFWDYFQFDDALAQLNAARTRFHQRTLFGFEAGAIQENRHNLPAAIHEYTAVATGPPETARFLDSLNAAVDALFRPPSDAADSNLRATTQSLFNAAEARSRLLQLAVRPATAALVDAATAQAAAGSATPLALTLRADVLIAAKRQAELAPLLEQAIARARTVDEAAAIGDLARTHSESPVLRDALLNRVTVTFGSESDRVERRFGATGSYGLTAVYEHALQKQIALSSDPLGKIELSYALSASLEARRQNAAAAKVVDGVYRENPRILGVVRATTDFYARTGQAPRAIGALLEAARAATPELARSFTLEAAQKANEAGDTRQARQLATSLLAANPYDGRYLAAVADSYARGKDDAGLKAFYEAQLAADRARDAGRPALSLDERKANTAVLRRGLILALARLKDYEGAEAQYIALISAYPEDASTAQEAALFALRYGLETQLTGFLRTTVQQSPQDARFAILLAQSSATFDDLPGALAAYTRAIAIRKDRADVYTARASLELRLGKTEEAAADYSRLYLLSYQDPAWMVRVAELRARQGRSADAVAALRTAYLTGHAASPADNFKVADQLADWNLLPDARSFAEAGVSLAGGNLLTSANGGGAASYARIMARLDKPEEALQTLGKVRRQAEADARVPAEIAADLGAAGVGARDLAQARTAYLTSRRQTADAQIDQAVRALGKAIQTYSTPESKLRFARSLDGMHGQPGSEPALALSAAAAAGLLDREAAWRREMLVTGPVNPRSPPDHSAFAALETRRLAFGELAATLETFAGRVGGGARPAILAEAAQAWRNSGNETNELRVRRRLATNGDAGLRDRYFDLLLRHDRTALAALAGNADDSLADAAANYAVAHGSQAVALAAVAGRGRTLAPVWTPASAALVGTYFSSAKSADTAATALNFRQALAREETVAERLQSPADARRQLTGHAWFGYGSRFGIFLETVPRAAALPDAEDFLAAELEEAPAAAPGYLHLARTYAEANNLAGSIAEFNHALELAPNNPAVHDDFAVVLFRARQRDAAVVQWRSALDLLRQRQLGEQFFAGFRSVLAHLAERSLAGTLRPESEGVLRAYLARNGNYRSNELLEAIYRSADGAAAGTALLVASSESAADPELVLADLANASWLPVEAQEAILLRRLQLARGKATPSVEADGAGDALGGGRQRAIIGQLVTLYVAHGDDAKAKALLEQIPERERREGIFVRAGILVAAHSGQLTGLLASYAAAPDQVPPLEVLTDAANALQAKSGWGKVDLPASRALREYVFRRKELTHTLAPADYLAPAQARLDGGDLAGAVALLHRLALQPDVPATLAAAGMERDTTLSTGSVANADAAAASLERTHHPAEALPFLADLVKEVPWNASLRVRYAEALRDSGAAAGASAAFEEVAMNAAAPYDVRLRAAEGLRSLPREPVTSSPGALSELQMIAGGKVSPDGARRPYFAAARSMAASAPGAPPALRTALLREAIAIEPAGVRADRARAALLLLAGADANPSATLAMLTGLDSPAQANFSDAAADAADDETETEGQSQTEGEADAAETEDEGESGDGAAVSPATLPPQFARTTDDATRLLLTEHIADAYLHAGQPDRALPYLLGAQKLVEGSERPDPALLKQIAGQIADLRATLRLEKRNAARRPRLSRDLDGSSQVRPRLSLSDQARMEAP